ncbi:MAG: ribosome maturation factor RimP [Burkholderiales bacterium]|nr:ribosome maturation factor RimP [Burkholderiales bacterium]
MDVTALFASTVEGLGYELVEVERSNRGRFLRVFIDLPDTGVRPRGRRAAGITVDDCEKVSRQLTYVLTVENVDYDRLEVSSPGLDRPLTKETDFARFEGHEVSVKLRAPLGGAHGVRKNFTGVARVRDGRPALEVDGEIIELDFARIDRARLVPVIEF